MGADNQENRRNVNDADLSNLNDTDTNEDNDEAKTEGLDAAQEDSKNNETVEENSKEETLNDNEIAEQKAKSRKDIETGDTKMYSTNASNNNTQTDTRNEKNTGNAEVQHKNSYYKENLKMAGSNPGLVPQKDDKLLDDSRTVVRYSPVWRQSLAASASILLTFTAGLTSGYSGILLPQLERPGSPILMDDSTKSWIAAMAALPMAPGCLISGWLMEKFGRKTSHYIICAPFLLGWILIACATNLELMLLGRFFTGLCVGLLGPLGPVYIGEISEPRLRGFFLAAISLAIAVGILVAHIIGTFMTWQWTATICCLFPILSVLLLMLTPESPTWLISKGEEEDGIKSFGWLRGYSDEAKAELKGIIDNQKAANSEPVLTLTEKLRSLKSPELIKPLFIMILFFITCQFSGVNAVAFYSIEIVEKAVGEGFDHYMAMIIIDLVRVVMSVIACVICKQFGRRPLCFISGIWTAISMVGLSIFLYWKPANMSWLPLTCLMVYICAISIGLVPLPWIMCGEVFPTRVRGLGSGISSATTFAAFFVVVKTAPQMMSNLGEVVTFLIYGIIALIGTGIMLFILPETKGKSLQEIEDRFRNGKINGPKV